MRGIRDKHLPTLGKQIPKTVFYTIIAGAIILLTPMDIFFHSKQPSNQTYRMIQLADGSTMISKKRVPDGFSENNKWTALGYQYGNLTINTQGVGMPTTSLQTKLANMVITDELDSSKTEVVSELIDPDGNVINVDTIVTTHKRETHAPCRTCKNGKCKVN